MKVLIIGSTVVDVILNVKKMPLSGEDENITSQTISLGGCAFNVYHTLKYLKVDCELFSPIGKGYYGDYVRKYFHDHDMPVVLESQKQNGCCYCVVEETGERTFLAWHGAEYLFEKEWFEQLKNKSYDMIYVNGLELEEQTGKNIIDFLMTRQEKIFFAPSSRFPYIDPLIVNDMMQLKPVIHLSQSEIYTYTKMDSLERAAGFLFTQTRQKVIVTLGEKGCYFYDGNHHFIKGIKVEAVDTTGAGDCHLAAYMAYCAMGEEDEKALYHANLLAAQVVRKKGSTLS